MYIKSQLASSIAKTLTAIAVTSPCQIRSWCSDSLVLWFLQEQQEIVNILIAVRMVNNITATG